MSVFRVTWDEGPRLASLGPDDDRTVASNQDAMTEGHRGGDYMPISSFPISSRSIFRTLLLAT
jgi:hypothetical protein